jgi:hypothetical protein
MRSKELITKVSTDIPQHSRGKVVNLVPSDSLAGNLFSEVSGIELVDSDLTVVTKVTVCHEHMIYMVY